MKKQNITLLTVAFILAIVFLIVPVAADNYVVTSNSYAPVAGTSVTISAQLTNATGANLTAGNVVTWSNTGTGSFTGTSSNTNASGIATVTFTTSTVAGTTYTITGTDGSSTGISQTITTVAGPAMLIAVNAGNSQLATAGTAVATAPSVKVTDANGNPVSGVSVSFTVSLGGGTVPSGTTTTTAYGIATVSSWTLGTTPGINSLIATSGSLTGSPLTFTATGTAASTTITAISSISGTAQVGSTLTAGSLTPSGATVTYQWLESNTSGGTYSAISGATSATYTPVIGDVSNYIEVNATGTGSYTGTVTSAAVGPVAAATTPVTNGTLYVSSSPMGASVFLSNVYLGTTTDTFYNITPGTYTLLLQKSGYQDWSDSVIITSGNQTTDSAYLKIATTETTEATAIPTTVATTVAVTKKSTIKVPTPWPSATPTTSPVEPAVIIGAIGLSVIVLRKL